MTKAEQIVNKHLKEYLIDNDAYEKILAAMKEIAELAFQAGVKYEFGTDGDDGKNIYPNQETFINNLFNQQL